MTDHDQPAAGVALKSLIERLDDEVAEASRMTEASPLERFVAEALTSDDAKAKGLVDRVWVVSLPDARKAIAAITEWNARAPTDAGGAVSEARQAAPKADGDWRTCSRAEYDAMPDLSAPQPLQQGGEVTRAVEVIVSEAIFEHRDNPTMCAADVSERATKRILALFASPDLGDLAGLVERLESMEIDPHAPGLRHTSLVNPDGPDAARALRSLAADRDKAVGLLRGLKYERKREGVRLCHLKRAVAVAWSEVLSGHTEGS